jgi:ATP-dependent DNA ligase
MLATAATVPPMGAQWSYEVKWGRLPRHRSEGRRTRQSHLVQREDLTRDYPTVVAAIARLKPAPVVLDGEPVAVDAREALVPRATPAHIRLRAPVLHVRPQASR